MSPEMGWERLEPGWYYREGTGGICHEEDGWWVYPIYPAESHGRLGPYRTCAEAMAAVESSLFRPTSGGAE